MDNQPKNIIKPLAEILIITDQVPADFYTNDIYSKKLDHAIAASNNLVYELTDEGEKQAKADAASVRKYAKIMKGFVLSEVKDKTKEVLIWKGHKINLIDRLLENPVKSLSQFEQRREEKLKDIRLIFIDEIINVRDSLNIKQEFRGCTGTDLLIDVRLSSATPKGLLTKKSKDSIQSLVNQELAEQNRIEARHLIIANECLTADINPPLTHIHLGTDFYADDDIFNAKVEELVQAEIERKAEMEARIRKQQEAEKQAEIDAALKAQQVEADRIAMERANAENNKGSNDPQEVPAVKNDPSEPEKTRTNNYFTRTAAKPAKSLKPKDEVVNGKHAVEITVILKMQISDRVSDKAVENHFMALLPEKLVSAIETIETKSCY